MGGREGAKVFTPNCGDDFLVNVTDEMAVVITWRTCLSTIKERGKLRFVIYFEAREMQFQTRVSSFLPTQNRYDPTNSGNKLKPFMEQYFKRTFRSFPLIHFHRRSKMDQDEFP